MALHRLEAETNLYNGYRRVFDVGGRRLLLLHHDDKTYLVDNICPHAGYPLESGRIGEDADIRCPMHGYLFDLATGDCTYSTEGPCRSLETFPVIRQAGWMAVELED